MPIIWAHEALDRFAYLLHNSGRPASKINILDVGSGSGEHADILRTVGFNVITCDLVDGEDYLETAYGAEQFDAIWCSHVLEHALDVHQFLRKLHYELKDGGLLAITVPPAKHAIVGGHVSLWNEGLLCYRLILAGFDCSQAMVGVYGYNISVIVEKTRMELPGLAMDNGDIERLADYFPVPMAQNTPGIFGDVRWTPGGASE